MENNSPERRTVNNRRALDVVMKYHYGPRPSANPVGRIPLSRRSFKSIFDLHIHNVFGFKFPGLFSAWDGEYEHSFLELNPLPGGRC